MSLDFLIAATMEKGEWKEKSGISSYQVNLWESLRGKRVTATSLKTQDQRGGFRFILNHILYAFQGREGLTKDDEGSESETKFLFFILFKFISTLFDIYIRLKCLQFPQWYSRLSRAQNFVELWVVNAYQEKIVYEARLLLANNNRNWGVEDPASWALQ